MSKMPAKATATKRTKGKVAIDYLPDADEIERSPIPPIAQWTLHLLVIALVAFVLWATFSQVEKVVSAQGSLVNPNPNMVVQPLETSIVQSIDVRPGQVVKKGDTLAVLDATFIRADENQLKLRLQSLEIQAKGLELEMSGKSLANQVIEGSDGQLQANLLAERKANYQAQQLRLGETAAKLRAALSSNRRDQALAGSRLRALREVENLQERLVAQKIGAPLQLLEAQIKSKEVERDLASVISREQELLRDLAASEAEKLAFEKSWRQKAMEDLLMVTRERDALVEQIQKADRRSRLVTLLAPEDAVVLDIAKLSPGSIVREAETFFTLVPLNTKLEVEAHLTSTDVGYIKLGQPVNLKIDAFPFQKHGTISANIVNISGDAFRKDSATKAGGDVYYKARIQMNDVNLKNMADKGRLLPGMTLTSEIVVGERSVLSYIFWPLLKGLDESIREP